MFVKNAPKTQPPLLNAFTELPEKARQQLRDSWAQTFYDDIFCQIDEECFSVLYSETNSRPNVPVNILMGLEILKDGNGWTDEETYNHFCYNLQVRYALGLNDLNEHYFDRRTIYNFRRRLVKHLRESGENLIERVFEKITQEQMKKYEVKGNVQRMDSIQITSNIRQSSRLQLLIEIVQRVERMFKEEDKTKYEELLSPYMKGDSSHYLYRLKGEKHQSHIEKIGQVMEQLVRELEMNYGEENNYKLLVRVFHEHFKQVEGGVTAKTGTELNSATVQSPDDLEATFRSKNGESHIGYVSNITETVNPEGLELITKVQVQPNNRDDAKMLAEAIPDLVDRLGLETIYTDGGYGSGEVDMIAEERGVEQHQTGIRGASPNPDKIGLSHCQFERDEEGKLLKMSCPHGVMFEVEEGSQEGNYIARLSYADCPLCAEQKEKEKREGEKDKKGSRFLTFYFSLSSLLVVLRRQRMLALQQTGHNPRSAVEATVREVTCRFNRAKLRVRGLYRVTMTMISSAMMCNIRRITQYLCAQKLQNETENQAIATKMRQNDDNMAKMLSDLTYLLFIHVIWTIHKMMPKPFRYQIWQESSLYRG